MRLVGAMRYQDGFGGANSANCARLFRVLLVRQREARAALVKAAHCWKTTRDVTITRATTRMHTQSTSFHAQTEACAVAVAGASSRLSIVTAPQLSCRLQEGLVTGAQGVEEPWPDRSPTELPLMLNFCP